jgi:hypothetical protein
MVSMKRGTDGFGSQRGSITTPVALGMWSTGDG